MRMQCSSPPTVQPRVSHKHGVCMQTAIQPTYRNNSSDQWPYCDGDNLSAPSYLFPGSLEFYFKGCPSHFAFDNDGRMRRFGFWVYLNPIGKKISNSIKSQKNENIFLMNLTFHCTREKNSINRKSLFDFFSKKDNLLSSWCQHSSAVAQTQISNFYID